MRTQAGFFFGEKEIEFNKPATSHEEQIELLKKRGMVIPSDSRAHLFLENINYYRLAAYWLPFESDHSTHAFKVGTNFEDVISLYVFDREFRLFVMDAIERVEVSLRTHWAYYIAHQYGPHAYLDQSIFRLSEEKHQEQLDRLAGEIRRSKEVFIAHYWGKYSSPPLPPIWSMVEVMSLGQFSLWYSKLRHRQDRKNIAQKVLLDEKILGSYLHHLTIVRNTCAHHSRLWNKKFGVGMKLATHPEPLANSLNKETPNKIYNTLVVLKFVLDQISPGNSFLKQLLELLRQQPFEIIISMGFPPAWKQLPVWQSSTKKESVSLIERLRVAFASSKLARTKRIKKLYTD